MSKALKIRKIELINRIQKMNETQFNELMQRVNGQIVCVDPFAQIRKNAGIEPLIVDENEQAE